ncbi:RNA-processing protein [Candidatus Woesearchaeota archaeon]|nr:RNA-processing protein [Candidatus Woesearchaeota archaeon]
MSMPDEYSYEIKIPKLRTAVLIGTKGDIKKKIQAETGTTVHIDSKNNVVTVSGSDAISLMDAQNIIKAIARGFNPEIAFSLLKPDYNLEIIDLKYVAKNKNDLGRIKGRIIGFNGKSRRQIEELTETDVCVFGKTVSIIGEISNVSLAKRAISNLIQGSQHTKVFLWLEKQRKIQRFEDGNEL